MGGRVEEMSEAKAASGLAPIMSAQQVMDWLGIKRTKLYNLIDMGLPFRSLSEDDRTKVFVPAEVQQWLDGRKRSRESPPEAEPGTEARSRRGRPRKDTPPESGGRKWIKGF
jgi:predicted DNA-binding transcriptional regulator AlpA